MKESTKRFLNIATIIYIIFAMIIGGFSQNNIAIANKMNKETKIMNGELKLKEESNLSNENLKLEEESLEVIQEDEKKELQEEQKEELLKDEVPKEEIIEESIQEEILEEEESVEDILLEESDIAEDYPVSNIETKLVFPSFNSKKLLNTRAITDSISVNKTAKRSPGCRTFEVNLGITGIPPVNPVDVVLVIDRSGSMNEISYDYIELTGNPSTSKSYYVLTDQGYQEVSRYSGYGNNAIWRYKLNGSKYVKFDASSEDSGAGSNSQSYAVGKKFYNKVEGLPRIDIAKQAAVNFAAKVLGSNGIPGSRVSIVSFSGPASTRDSGEQKQASTDQQLTNDLNKINTSIDKITAVGGTNTEAGFLQGRNEITSRGSQQNPDSNKVVIMFTDGLPTASNGNKYAVSTDINYNYNIFNWICYPRVSSCSTNYK